MVAVAGPIRAGDLVEFELDGEEYLGKVLDVYTDCMIDEVEQNVLCRESNPGARVELVLDWDGTLIETGHHVGVFLKNCSKVLRMPLVEPEILDRQSVAIGINRESNLM